jgi:hypothetical protein
MHETSGVLKPVIRRYLQGHRLEPYQVGIMRAYLEQWFDSPVWRTDNDGNLESIRVRVHQISETGHIRAVLKDALELGIDPLYGFSLPSKVRHRSSKENRSKCS